MNPEELRKQAAQKIAQAKMLQGEIDADDSDLTPEQVDKRVSQIDELIQQAEGDKSQADEIARDEQENEARRVRMSELESAIESPLPRKASPSEPGATQESLPSKVVVPANVKRYGTLKHFSSDERAYSFGQWCLGAIGSQSAAAWCQDHGIELNQASHVEKSNALGGFLVPEQFENDLIDLRELYGVFRREARVRPMSSDTRTDPRRTGGLTASFVGEDGQGAASTKSWDRVSLVAKKIMTLSLYTNELSEDAVINIGDDLAGEIAYAFSLKEDQCGFNGDGTSTFGGIEGITTKIEADSNLAGYVLAASGVDTADEITLAECTKVVGSLPLFPGAVPKWYVSQYVWANGLARLAWAAGGNTKSDIASGSSLQFLGAPVVISQVLPSTGDLSGQAMCLYGDLRLAASLGDRRQTTINFSTDATVDGKSAFEYDSIAIRGTERFDINVHDIGDTSSAGPVVALIGN